ncbi:hypothetical protein CFK37_07590 [Virgibacillus phasianinus]|uniref:YwdI family protein n=1 Tax=Virgibacillus phasianinus TaxID=2017483 RepID=A0A220U1S1_9BACI|nr:YwdI family protein [Virgibacillus phasianinus]ASK62030.1 hypothetical protein CFK37_07590 [Virgibacillus phasianinus]
MAIPNETILKKMMEELKQAKSQQADQRKMVKHIEHVRLLCDLIIDVEQAEPDKGPANISDISTDEMKAMLGSSSKPINEKRASDEDHEDANGKSIFDF